MIGFAHRGARALARENTLDAFSLALRLGATGIESDAWVTEDGVVVLDHDGVVRRQWRRVPISDVARVDLPAHITSLDTLFEICGHDFELSLDIKDASAMPAVLTAVHAVGAASRLWACHYSVRTLGAWRQEASDVRLVHSSSLSRLKDGVPAAAARAGGAGVDAINLRLREWTNEAVAAVHEAGLRAFGWDAQTDQELTKAVALGLDGVYSDHVDRMVRVLTASQADGR